MADNPYQAPSSEVAPRPIKGGISESAFRHLAHGQRLTGIAFLVLVCLAFLKSTIGEEIHYLSSLAALAVGAVGLVRILIGSKIGRVWKILVVAAMLLPPWSLIVILVVCCLPTRELRKAGYEVGFFGVKGGYMG